MDVIGIVCIKMMVPVAIFFMFEIFGFSGDVNTWMSILAPCFLVISFNIYGAIVIFSFYRELKENYVRLEERESGIDDKDRIFVVDEHGEIFVHNRSV